MPATYSELLLVIARKCAIGAKKAGCIQKIFDFKNIIKFCGFNIKIENLILFAFFYDGTTLTTINQQNPHKNLNHHEL